MISSTDPRTGAVIEELDRSTSPEDVARLCAQAATATDELSRIGRKGRAAMLRTMAAAIEARREELVSVADRETGLGRARLDGELTRSRFQLELFADVLDEGAYLEATVDHPSPTPMGPRPDLRRMLVPLGPVAVFGASNFPFAFSVLGGDVASALAAGCAVVAKAHSAHPATSILSCETLMGGAREAGMRSSVVSLVFGQQSGMELVRDPTIQAVGFTGSLAVGRLLFDAASSRPSPIPFYGELGALNTLSVCRGAARNRGAEIGTQLAASFTLGVGQFCTKPGLALIPAGADGETLISSLVEAVNQLPAGVMLSERTAKQFASGITTLQAQPGVEVLARGDTHDGDGWWGTPTVLRAPASAVQGPLAEECFGPVVVLVEYDADEDLLAHQRLFGPALTGAIHADEEDHDIAGVLFRQVSANVGRVVWNGYPTGVAVSWAQHHGGPYPATTNALHTSVGATSIRRWLRPISLQDVPMALLPDELRDQPADGGLPRRIDGQLIPRP